MALLSIDVDRGAKRGRNAYENDWQTIRRRELVVVNTYGSARKLPIDLQSNY